MNNKTQAPSLVQAHSKKGPTLLSRKKKNSFNVQFKQVH